MRRSTRSAALSSAPKVTDAEPLYQRALTITETALRPWMVFSKGVLTDCPRQRYST
jgi:hypothetical protein